MNGELPDHGGDPWGPWPLDHRVRRWSRGALTLWACRVPDGLRVLAVEGEAPADPPARGRWHLHHGIGEETAGLRPALPLLPVQVRCPGVLHLAPGALLRLEPALPLEAQLVHGETVLADWPLKPRRHSWLGTPQHGERVLSQSASGLDPACTASCPVLLHNRSDTPLQLDRVLVPAGLLSLFMREDRLATDELRITCTAGEAWEVQAGGGVPAGWITVSGPRSSGSGGLLGRALVGLRDLPDVLRGRR